jgi:prepilin-type N-terminal cleavage/methylation domain-containing protein
MNNATDQPRTREPRPGELCSCGRPAVLVYLTDNFGDVGWCGRSDGGDRRTPRTDRGFALVEVLVVIVLMGLLAGPLAALLSTAIRATASAERAAVRLGVAVTAQSIAGRIAVVDECDGAGYEAEIAGRVTIPAGWSVEVLPDCSEVPTVIEVVVVDDHGGATQLIAVRP